VNPIEKDIAIEVASFHAISGELGLPAGCRIVPTRFLVARFVVAPSLKCFGFHSFTAKAAQHIPAEAMAHSHPIKSTDPIGR
jgi:hypothetical protein